MGTKRIALVVVAPAVLLLGSAGQAQTSAGDSAAQPSPPASAAPVAPACQVVDVAAADARAELYLACGKVAVRLGGADRYSSSYHAATGSTVVVLYDGARTQVELIAPAAGGTLHVDEISRELTRLSGRYFDAGLGDTAVDLARFALDGSVSVAAVAMPKAAEGKAMAAAARGAGNDAAPAAADTTATLDLKPYAARVAGTAAVAPAATMAGER